MRNYLISFSCSFHVIFNSRYSHSLILFCLPVEQADRQYQYKSLKPVKILPTCRQCFVTILVKRKLVLFCPQSSNKISHYFVYISLSFSKFEKLRETYIIFYFAFYSWSFGDPLQTLPGWWNVKNDNFIELNYETIIYGFTNYFFKQLILCITWPSFPFLTKDYLEKNTTQINFY